MCTGAAADRYGVEVKEKMYSAKCAENVMAFYPMVVEVFGVWGEKANVVLHQIATMISSRSASTVSQCKMRMMQRLSVTLHRCNARALLSRQDFKEASLEDPLF